jgi:hypothetical protein
MAGTGNTTSRTAGVPPWLQLTMLRTPILYCCALVPAVASLFLGGGNRQIAADEAFVANAYGTCAAFTDELAAGLVLA